MDETYTYQIRVRDGVDDVALNAASPVKVSAARVEPDATLLTTCTDQSGLIGLLRYVHQQGYVLLSVTREP
ncbi:MAG: hypothetical protein R3248_04725 [Candidatus Promineifilaceae bacterium]|nr:hypothetical protein [Candidatus Promineifilaceae bacterium]